MKILISHVYSNDNKGDAALLSVLLGDIRRVFNNPHVTVLTLDDITEGEMFDGVPVANGFMHYASDRHKNPLLRGLYALCMTAGTLTWACVYRYTGMDAPLPKHLRAIVRLYKDSDLVIPVGGGYIRSQRGLRATLVLFFILYPLLFVAIIRKPTIGYTQSVGPFGNKFQEWMAKFAVKRMKGIVVREKISLELLQTWGITKNVYLSVDSGFAFESNHTKDIRKGLGISTGQMLVGVTVRNWLDPKAQSKYERIMAKFADYIAQRYQAMVVFIPQVTVENHQDDDRKSSERVYACMQEKVSARVMTERFDHHTIKGIYGGLDYLVGTRFHSVIFALTSYVPAIAVGYEHKTLGIMTDLGLEKWVIDIKTVETHQLAALFDQLVEGRQEYVDELKKVLPTYSKKAHEAIFFVKEVYEKVLSF